jgi:DNA-binding PadR family transcriptional regulator
LHVAKKSSIINQNELFNQTKSKKRNYEHWKHTKPRCVRVLEFCILSVLKKRCIHIGNIRHIKKRKVISSWGTIYPLLTRLKNDGLNRWEESHQDRQESITV